MNMSNTFGMVNKIRRNAHRGSFFAQLFLQKKLPGVRGEKPRESRGQRKRTIEEKTMMRSTKRKAVKRGGEAANVSRTVFRWLSVTDNNALYSPLFYKVWYMTI